MTKVEKIVKYRIGKRFEGKMIKYEEACLFFDQLTKKI
jgi:hypothetical protein